MAREPEVTAEPVAAEVAESEADAVEPAVVAEPEVVTAKVDLDLDELVRVWPEVLQKLAETAPALVATFEGARPVALGEDRIEIGFPADRTFNKKKAESPERRDAVAVAFEGIVGRSIRPTYVLLDGESVGDDEAPETEKAAVDEEELLERLKSEFDAEEVS